MPKIGIYSSVLDFEDCFMGHPYRQTLRVVNESKLPAKFEVLPQDTSTRALAEYTAEPSSGGIAAQGTHTGMVVGFLA